jgi:hypothetical protein
MNSIFVLIGVIVLAVITYKLGKVNGHTVGLLELEEKTKALEIIYTNYLKNYCTVMVYALKELKRLLSEDKLTEETKVEILKSIDNYIVSMDRKDFTDDKSTAL